MLIEQRKQRVYASQRQIWVEDPQCTGYHPDCEFWTPKATLDRLAAIQGRLGIFTESYANVEVRTEIHDREPPLELIPWDHVTEVGLKVSSGRLRVGGCTAGEIGEEFRLARGSYRVRCCHANLAAAADDGEGGDWYLVQLWPSRDASRKVLKHNPGFWINSLPLPQLLLDLAEAGRWKCAKDSPQVRRLLPGPLFPGGGELTLYSLAYMPFENKSWLDETKSMFLGAPDPERPPGDIDPKQSVLIGDLGLGSDQPIALDYRMSVREPRVLTLAWSPYGRSNRWVEIAATFRELVAVLGL